METTEKTRSDATTPERAEAGNADGLSPASNCTTKGGGIASLLLEGPENALTLRNLERLTALDGRTIRRQIEAERRRGTPILSDCKNGYYLPACDYDRQRFVGQMRGRAREILKTARAVEQGGTNLDQLTIEALENSGAGCE